MRRKEILLVLLILSAFFAGCSAKYVGKSYDGPDLPESEIGTVIFNRLNRMFNNQAAVSCKVDGIRVDMDPEKRSVNMLPGKRTVLFMYDGKRPLVAVEWTFNVEAGHKYLITLW